MFFEIVYFLHTGL